MRLCFLTCYHPPPLVAASWSHYWATRTGRQTPRQSTAFLQTSLSPTAALQMTTCKTTTKSESAPQGRFFQIRIIEWKSLATSKSEMLVILFRAQFLHAYLLTHRSWTSIADRVWLLEQSIGPTGTHHHLVECLRFSLCTLIPAKHAELRVAGGQPKVGQHQKTENNEQCKKKLVAQVLKTEQQSVWRQKRIQNTALSRRFCWKCTIWKSAHVCGLTYVSACEVRHPLSHI